MLVNDTKIYQKVENESLFSIERNIIEWGKMQYYNYNDSGSSFDEEFKNLLKNQHFEVINLLQKANLNKNLL